MILYHGGTGLVVQPVLARSRSQTALGAAFFATDWRLSALFYAVIRAEESGGLPVVSRYRLEVPAALRVYRYHDSVEALLRQPDAVRQACGADLVLTRHARAGRQLYIFRSEAALAQLRFAGERLYPAGAYRLLWPLAKLYHALSCQAWARRLAGAGSRK